MKRLVVAGVALVLVLSSACSDKASISAVSTATASSASSTARAFAVSPAPTASPGRNASLGAAAPDVQRTLAHIHELAEAIGPRVAGSPGEDKAVDYIAAQFRADGYDVEVQQFEFRDRGFLPETLIVGSDEVAARQLTGSAQQAVSGAAVYVGLADAGGIGGRNLTGKVAIADRGTLTFDEKAANVSDAGAAALVVINNGKGLFNGRVTSSPDIVAVGVGSEDGGRLRTAAASGETITINVPKAVAKNVLARPKPGATCDLLVGGHHDTVPDVPGASDNASGASTVVELARAFAADGLDESLCFATFGAEESGLFGSQALLQELQAAGKPPKLMVNLDVLGTGDTVEIIGDRALSGDAAALATALGIPARETTDPAGTSSDHATFLRAGIPAVFLAANDYSKIHTPGDTVSIIDPKLLDESGKLAYALIAQELPKVAQP